MAPATRAISIGSRRTERFVAGLGAVGCLGLALYTAISQADPVLHLYDGFWMIGGTGIAVLAVAPLVWRWPRERAMAAMVTAAAIGCWAPLVVLALRAGVPVAARLKGAVFFSNADVVGVALPVGVVFAWLTLRENRAERMADAGNPEPPGMA